MRQRSVVVPNPSGLHARPAARFVQTAKRFSATVRLTSERGDADGKSILSVLRLGVKVGTAVTLTCDGEDEEEAVGVLAGLIEAGLGEGAAIYRSVVTGVGPEVAEFLSGGVLVFFAQGAPRELQSFSVLHRPVGRPTGRLQPRAQIRLGSWSAAITAVGSEADYNLAELGHLVLKLGGGQVDLPGQVAVEGSPASAPAPGDDLRIVEPAEGGAGA